MNALMLIGMIGVPVAGAQFGVDYSRAIRGDETIWWTPASMALPLDQTHGSFQIYLDNEPLRNHLARGSLTALDKDGLAYFVTPELIRVRLNNWPPVKASLLHRSVFSAFALGLSLTALGVGLFEFFRQPPPRRRPLDGQARPLRR